MDSEMIEKVARKLAMFMFDTWGDAEGVVWSGLDPNDKAKAQDAARAAITAYESARTPDPAIVKLRERVAVLERQRLTLLAAVYREAPKFIATICDEDLDPSGALLGEVRTLADAALSPSQQDKRL